MQKLLLQHHAMLHASEKTQAEVWSYADEIWQGLTEADARRIPPKQEHSIVWIIWHIARIEDITMAILVAGRPAGTASGRPGWRPALWNALWKSRRRLGHERKAGRTAGKGRKEI